MCEGKILTTWANEDKLSILINRNLTVAKVHEGSKHLGKIKGYGSIENKINSVKLNVNCSKESQKRLRDWGNTC